MIDAWWSGFLWGAGIGTVVAWTVACVLSVAKAGEECSECWLRQYKPKEEETK